MAMETETVLPAGAVSARPGTSYLEWGAVFGGAMLALAITVVLVQFGAGVGLSVGDPVLEDGTFSWNVAIAGLWVILVAVASASAGGYLAGRMRSRFHDANAHEVEFRDGAHGIVVWAVSTVVAILAMAVLSALSAVGVSAQDVTGDMETPAEVVRYAAQTAVVFNFASAAGAALAAAAAWFAATTGGAHRDEGADIHRVVPGFIRRKVIVTT
jgi:hypothetical protein